MKMHTFARLYQFWSAFWVQQKLSALAAAMKTATGSDKMCQNLEQTHENK